MSAQNGSAAMKEDVSEGKGKGKAAAEPAQESGMDVDDSSSEEEVDEEAPVADEPDEDNMEEIDTDNIITGGRRTRGVTIDFSKAAAELPEEDDEDEDDGDFEAGDDDEEMKD